MDPNLDLQESGWEELRKEARKIEGDLDVKLSSYAKLGARFTQGGSFFSFYCFSFFFSFQNDYVIVCFCIAFWLLALIFKKMGNK